MLRTVFLVGVAILALQLAWWFNRPPPPAPFPHVNTSFSGRHDARSPEVQREELRRQVRRAALNGLNAAWSSFCTDDGRKRLRDALNYYFEHRTNQQRDYASRGPEAEREGREAWASADDQRIERLLRETYGRGYFKPSDLTRPAQAIVAELVRNERVTGHPCTS